MIMSEEIDPATIQLTRESLSPFISKPPLTDKLLRKPPFKFLHDLIIEVIKQHGLMAGLFNEQESLSENVKDKEAKVSFLQKVVDVMEFVCGEKLSVRPGKVVAGLEVAHTNTLLQTIGRALTNKTDSSEAVSRVLAGEKFGGRKSKSKEQKSSKSMPSGDGAGRSVKQSRQEREAKRTRPKHSKEVGLSSERPGPAGRERAGSRDKGRPRQIADQGGGTAGDNGTHEEKISVVANGDGLPAGGGSAGLLDSSTAVRDEQRPPDNGSVRKEGVPAEPRKSRRSKSRDPGDEVTGKKEHRPKERGISKEKSRDAEDETTGKKEHRAKERGISKDKLTQNGKELKKEKSKEKKDKESKKDTKKDKETKVESKKHKDPNKIKESKKEKDNKKDRTSKNGKTDRKGSVLNLDSAAGKDSTRPSHQSNIGQELERKRSPSPVLPPVPTGDDFIQLNDVSLDRDPVRPSTARTRPGSARAAPPPSARARSRAGLVVEQLLDEAAGSADTPAAAELQPAIILDSAGGGEAEDEDSHYHVQEEEEETGREASTVADNVESAVYQVSDGQHGRLVSQIIESKRSMEQQMSTKPSEGNSGDQEVDGQLKHVRQQEVQQLLECVQGVTRSANPLGKMIDFLQEDIDSMKRELDTWRQERISLHGRIDEENKKTESSIEPLRTTLSELQLTIAEQKDKIGAVRGAVVADALRIDKLLTHVLKVAQ